MTAVSGVSVRSLYKSLSLGAARALVRLVCGFISVKLTAVYLGPSGMALIAQFNNFMSLCQGIVTSGLETAASRLTSEYASDPGRRTVLLHTLGRIALAAGLATAAVVALLSPWLAQWLLNDSQYAWVFILGSLAILAMIANSLLLAVLSARDGYVRSISSIMLATVAGLMIFAPAAMHWGITGGLLASSVVYAASLFITLMLIRGSGLVTIKDFVGRFNRGEAKRVAAFYPMLIVHAALTPLSLILIRNNVAEVLDLNAAGLWQACWRLSETYLLIVMSMVSTQFMVRLGRVIKDRMALRKEIVRTLGVAVGGTAGIALVVYVLREWIVRILFSSAFLPVADLLPIQLIGDIVKMIGWTLGFALVATLRSRWYIAIEIVVPLAFVGTAQLLGRSMGVSSVTTAYAVSGAIQAIMSIVALRDILFHRGERVEFKT